MRYFILISIFQRWNHMFFTSHKKFGFIWESLKFPSIFEVILEKTQTKYNISTGSVKSVHSGVCFFSGIILWMLKIKFLYYFYVVVIEGISIKAFLVIIKKKSLTKKIPILIRIYQIKLKVLSILLWGHIHF